MPIFNKKPSTYAYALLEVTFPLKCKTLLIPIPPPQYTMFTFPFTFHLPLHLPLHLSSLSSFLFYCDCTYSIYNFTLIKTNKRPASTGTARAATRPTGSLTSLATSMSTRSLTSWVAAVFTRLVLCNGSGILRPTTPSASPCKQQSAFS
jgi:hypothetical protein